jgi:hypothetical protein
MKATSGGDHAFKVDEWKRIDNGALKGSFSLVLPSGMIIKSCTLFQRSGERWVGLPSRPYAKRDGATGYDAFLEFTSKELKAAFQRQALAALDRFLEVVGG